MDMTEISDIEYIHRIRQGDTNAFVYLVRRYQRMIFSLVVKMVGNQTEVEDLTQEIFIKVYQSLAKFREDSKFSTWIYRVACNFCFSHLRKSHDRFISLNEEMAAANECSDFEQELEQAASEERIQSLDAVLSQLPAEELWIVTLYYKENVSVHEISEITRLSESNVKVKLHRTRKWIRSEMEKRMRL